MIEARRNLRSIPPSLPVTVAATVAAMPALERSRSLEAAADAAARHRAFEMFGTNEGKLRFLVKGKAMEIPMFTKTKLVLAAVLVLGAASAVQASDKDRNDTGGYRTGPQGQSFQGANPAYHRSLRHGGGDYAFSPDYRSPAQPSQKSGESRFERNWFGYQNCPGTEGGC
jgi:hypothetical protein